MSSLFKEVFFPTEEQIIRQENIKKEIIKEAIQEKHCIVCKYYSYDASIPGFITYEGDCELGYTPFFGKHFNCKNWKRKE